MKITSKKLMANYPIKTISKYFKQTPLYNTKWWMTHLTDIYYPLKNEYLLSKKTAEALTVINPKTQKFYITPKIHTQKKKSRETCHWLNQLSHLSLLTITWKFIFSYHGCKSFICKCTKQRMYFCCQTKTRQLHKENRSHKSDINILSTYFDTTQLRF